MNAGNYGLPVNLFAFGQAGLARASLYFTVSAAAQRQPGRLSQRQRPGLGLDRAAPRGGRAAGLRRPPGPGSSTWPA